MSIAPIQLTLVRSTELLLVGYERLLAAERRVVGNTDAGDVLSHDLACVRATIRELHALGMRYDDSLESEPT